MITERLRRVAENNSGRLAIIDGRERITYGELLRRVDGARAWLDGALHIQPGDKVFVTMESSWQYVACLFATAELGGILVPCRAGSPAAELKAYAERVGIDGVITGPESRHDWNGIVSLDRILDVPDRFQPVRSSAPEQRMDPQSPVLYVSTSGSTGVPRIVPRTQSNLLAGATNVARTLGIDSGRRFLSVIPLHFVYAAHNNVLLPLLNGATVILVRQFSPGNCAEIAASEGADILFGSPFVYRLLLDHSHRLASLKLCFSSGARMSHSLSAAWQRENGVRIRQWYGATETHVMTADHSPEPPPTGILGTAIHGVEMRLLDSGELAVRSPMVMPGYVGAPELNAEVFVDGYYRTGDLGSLDSQGRLKLLGRIRRMINVAGLKIDPVEVEQAIESLEGVVACHVDSAGGEPDSEIMRAQIQVRPGASITRAHVIAHCRQRLSEYKLPRVVEFVDALPVTVTGKIVKATSEAAKPASAS